MDWQLIFSSFLHYCEELFFPIALGFFLSGLISEFVPDSIVNKHLGKKGLYPILVSSFFGTLLPLCCFGSLPVAVTLRKKGAHLGPVLAFLVTTPATSVSALLVCYKLLGLTFTVYIFFGVILMGVATGLVGNLFRVAAAPESKDSSHCCCGHSDNCSLHPSGLSGRILSALRYAFVTLPRELGVALVVGIAVASLVEGIPAVRSFIGQYLTGWSGYLFSLLTAHLTYVCSTATVPLTQVLIQNGLPVGAGMMFLLVGPITSYSSILVLGRDFGVKVLVAYLLTISTASFALGVLFDLFFA